MTKEETKKLAYSFFDILPTLRDKFFMPLSVVHIGEVTVRQSDVLLALVHNGPLTMTELAALAGISNQLLTSVVNSLEEMGYVKRTPLPNNKRTIKIDITDQGHEVLIDYRDRVAQELCKALKNISDEDYKEMMSLLDRFFGLLAKYPNKRKDS